MISRVSKRKKSRNGCLSCKRLKIKCDEAKPSCEYCRHTRRMCVYPETMGNQLTEFQVTTINDYLTTKLNQPSTQLNLTRFELRLLTYFNQQCLTWYVKERKEDMKIEWTELPYEFLRSDLVRFSVFSFASLMLDDQDLSEIHRIDNLLDDEYTNMPNSLILKQHLTSTQFFNQSISKLNTVLSTSTDLTTAKLQYNTAMDIHISSALIYNYLCLSPLKMVSLISLDRANPDFISIIKGMQHTMDIASMSFEGTRFQGMYNSSFSPDANTLPPYVLITNLKDDLPNASDPTYPILLNAIEGLHRGLVIAVKRHYPVPLTRWLLFLKPEFYDLLYLENPLALRLLHTFSCLILILRFFISESENIWREFVGTYKNKIFSQHGQWTNPHDEALYIIAVDIQLRILKDQCTIFDNLDPITLVSWCHSSPNNSPDFTVSGLSSSITTPGLSSTFATPDFSESLFDDFDLLDFDPPGFDSPALSL